MLDRIEREIVIAARPEHVWAFVVEPGFWVTDDERGRGTAAVEGTDIVVRHSEHGTFPMRILRVDPPRYLACRWVSAFPGDDLRDDNSTLVEFTLTAEGAGTRLRVVESGFCRLSTSEANRQNIIDDHAFGWEQCASTLMSRTAA